MLSISKTILPSLTLILSHLFCIYGSINVQDLDKVGEVVFVSVLFRHGDRTPIDPYPNDPYGNLSYWPVGWGQLTNKGKQLHYERGKWMRARYDSLLGPNYRKEVIRVQSTDVDRTLMSAESHMAGLFPPSGGQVWNKLAWQPVPIHTTPEKLDKLLAMKFPCKKYEQELKLVKHSEFIKSLNDHYKELFEYVTLHTGHKIDNLDQIEYLYSNLHIETLFNFTLPDWTKKVYPEPLKTASAISFIIPTLNKKLQRLKSGPLLGDIVGHMNSKVKGSLDERMWVYSAHDTTIANLLNTLGVYNGVNPPYGAMVLMELRKDTVGQHFVTVLYKNVTSDEPHVFQLPGCSEACPLETFTALCQPLVPVDWEAECHAHHLFDLTNDLPYNSLAIFGKLLAVKDIAARGRLETTYEVLATKGY